MERNETKDIHSRDSPRQTERGDTGKHTADDVHCEHLETKDQLCVELSEMAVGISLDCFEEDEDWKDSVKKCKHGKFDGKGGEDGHHSEYLETSDPHVEGIIREMICLMFDDGEVYRDILGLRLQQELESLNEAISALQEGSEEHLPDKIRLASRVIPSAMLLEHCHEAVKNSLQKREERETKALRYFYKELDYVTREIMRKVDGVVRVQRKTTESREHGTGTGIVLRLGWSGTCYARDRGKHTSISEKDDFVILTNNHVIANDVEAKGARIDFFYNCCAGNEMQGQPPPGVISKSVTQVITWSPRVPDGATASSEKMDFSILKFDVGTDMEFIKKLGDVSFYLNEFLENDLIFSRPPIQFSSPLPLVAISHPHGSNKRISFGRVVETEVDKLCCEEIEHYSSVYDLTTCLGSSGCPVLAIQVNSRGRLTAALQFLHFKTKCGIAVSKVYSACQSRTEIKDEYGLFQSVLNSRHLTFHKNSTAAWWDKEDRPIWGSL